MKKLLIPILTLALLVCLCGGWTLTGQAASEAVTVASVDALIEAIAPGAVIQLTAGTFDLAEASTYGGRSGNPYVKWEEKWNGWQLVIHDADGLVIRGAGKGATVLRAECTDANVIEIQDCTEVVLQDFTAGHVYQADGCNAGVVRIYRSSNTSLIGLGLYGCGSWGVSADYAGGLMILNTDIYECSSTGVSLYDCTDVSLIGGSFHDNGGFENGYCMGYSVYSFSCSAGISVSDTSVTGNSTSFGMDMSECTGVSFENVDISANSFTEAVMRLSGSDVTFGENVSFSGNSFSRWYAPDWDTGEVTMAHDAQGEPVNYDDPEPFSSSSEPAQSVPVTTGEQTTVRVNTVDELLAAIGPNVRIVLAESFYDLSAAEGYGYQRTPWYYWEEEFDGYGLVIVNVSDFSIVSEDGAPEGHLISALPRYADVLTFRNCANVTLSGFTAGHSVEPGYCAGGVLSFEYCSQVLTENCDLYGCGILGVYSEGTVGLQVINSCIHDCSYGGIKCSGTSDITIGGCTFRDLGGMVFQFYGCRNVTVNGRSVGGSYCGD